MSEEKKVKQKEEVKGIEELLVSGSYVTAEDMGKAIAFSKKKNTPFTEYLLRENLITKDLLGQAMAESFGVRYADLNSASISAEQVRAIPEEVAKKYRVVLFSKKDREIKVTTNKPKETGLLEALQPIFKNAKISVLYSLSEDIESLFIHYRKPLETRFSKILEKKDRAIPELLEEIFKDAISFKASDIHFEPGKEQVLIRFRVDGVLQEAGRIPLRYYENVINRIKVQSGLRIDEHFSTQDGALRFEHDNTTFDFRTSIAPTILGEKIVLRILSAYVQGFTLANLGLSPEQQEMMRSAAQKPFGMILISGPTGSGKTTTLYSLINILNTEDVNITTIEDPVEYKVKGVNQMQVNSQTNLTFAKGLRSIVRQDPDVILVGEIRDSETAEISVNAALTGHLLLSTFHANDAATSIPRLINMGVEPFLLASTLNVIVSQRLIRTICESCRHGVAQKSADLGNTVQPYFKEKEFTLYVGAGCKACGGSGYKGRTAVYESILITPEIQDAIIKKSSSLEIQNIARAQGSKSLFEDGIEKVKTGVTTLEELVRVAEPPSQEKTK